MRSVTMLGATLLLAGCGGGGENRAAEDQGTQISIKGGDGSAFAAGVGKDGRISVDAPGFKGSVKLPGIKLDADNFDINGVSLPAGSRISSLDVDGRGEDGVRVAFTSPVGTAAVRDWFQGRLAAEGFKIAAEGDNLSGTTDDGKAFSLTTRAAGDGNTESVIAIGK